MDGEIDSEIKCYANAELCKVRMRKPKFIQLAVNTYSGTEISRHCHKRI